MKPKHQNPFRASRAAALAGRAGLVGLVACSGCTHVAKHRLKAQTHLAEESRALTSAVVDALQLQPAPQRDPYTATALFFAKQDQHIAGLPLAPFDVPALLAATNAVDFAAAPLAPDVSIIPAQEEVQQRFTRENKLTIKERIASDRLVELGVESERISNQHKLRWFKFGSFTTVVVGSFVALAVFCPIALPLVGRVLAWCVSLFPALASKLGVVAVGAFDALVRGVEHFKSTAPSTGNGIDPATQDLHASFSREMDSAHKKLVRTRKADLDLT